MERFTSLSKETTALYLPGSPVMISAQALLKDNTNDNVFAQIKFKSLSDKPICALKVSVNAWDVTGKSMQGVDEFQYLDLTAKPDDDFGSKTLIPLPDKNSRGFKAAVLEAAFADKTVWTAAPGAVWEPLTEQEHLVSRLKSIELVDEYALKTCAQAQFVPVRFGDIWRCTCGSVNTSRRESCGACGQRYDDLIRALDAGALEASYKERREREAELEERKQTEAAARKKRTKKLVSIVIAAAILCVAATLVMTKIVMPSMLYNKAAELYNRGEYTAAQRTFEELGDYKDAVSRAIECRYSTALDDIKAGRYADAAETLTELGNYKDSQKKLDEIKVPVQIEFIARAEEKDVVTFGQYEQDNNVGNGKEDIEWIVLAKEKGRALLLSKYCIACELHNKVNDWRDMDKPVTWEECTLRTWLNGEFYRAAFGSDEQKAIIQTTVPADKNPDYRSKNPGNDTQDKVFILSVYEANTYFDFPYERKAMPTVSLNAHRMGVDENGVFVADNGCCYWWLRTPGGHDGVFASVDFNGNVYNRWYPVDEDDKSVGYIRITVRPAIWVDIGQ